MGSGKLIDLSAEKQCVNAAEIMDKLIRQRFTVEDGSYITINVMKKMITKYCAGCIVNQRSLSIYMTNRGFTRRRVYEDKQKMAYMGLRVTDVAEPLLRH